jgi:hypothetical protein
VLGEGYRLELPSRRWRLALLCHFLVGAVVVETAFADELLNGEQA